MARYRTRLRAGWKQEELRNLARTTHTLNLAIEAVRSTAKDSARLAQIVKRGYVRASRVEMPREYDALVAAHEAISDATDAINNVDLRGKYRRK